MTKTNQVLALMSEGVPITSRDIAAMTGWSIDQATQTLWNMKQSGYVNVSPLSYTITPEGVARGKRKPVTRARDARRAELARLDAEKPRDGDGILQYALRQPNSVFALGAA